MIFFAVLAILSAGSALIFVQTQLYRAEKRLPAPDLLTGEVVPDSLPEQQLRRAALFNRVEFVQGRTKRHYTVSGDRYAALYCRLAEKRRTWKVSDEVEKSFAHADALIFYLEPASPFAGAAHQQKVEFARGGDWVRIQKSDQRWDYFELPGIGKQIEPLVLRK